MDEPQIVRLYRTFNAAAEAFREESERHEGHGNTARGRTP
jgi:hypothetical protein